MKQLRLFGLGCAGVLTLIACGGLAMFVLGLFGVFKSDDQRIQDLVQQQIDRDRWNGFWDSVFHTATPVATILVVVIGCVLGLALVFWIVRQIDLYLMERKQADLILPVDGQWPMHVADVRTPQAAELRGVATRGYWLTEVEAARASIGQPHTYAPHQITETSAVNNGPPLIDQAAPPALPAPLMTFGEVISTGLFQPTGRMILGLQEDSQPFWQEVDKTFSAFVPGGPGTGKTWTIVELVCWLLLNGAEVWLADPHMGDDESLFTRLGALQGFLAGAASEPGDMSGLLEAFQRRIHARRQGTDKARHMLVLLVDELAALMDPFDSWGACAPLMAHILESTGNQYRKFRCVTFAATQNVKGTRTGGTETRAAFTCRLIHNLPPEQLKMLPLDEEQRDVVGSFPRSWFLFRPNMGEARPLRTPEIGPGDVRAVAAILEAGRAAGSRGSLATVPADRPPVAYAPATPTETGPDWASGSLVANESAPARAMWDSSGSRVANAPDAPPDILEPLRALTTGPQPSPRACRVHRVWREEGAMSGTVLRMWGVRSDKGREYQDLLNIADAYLDEYEAWREGVAPNAELQATRAKLERTRRLDDYEQPAAADRNGAA